MTFSPGDVVVVTKVAPMARTGQRARVLGLSHRLDGYFDVTFEDGKPYVTYAPEELALAPVDRVGTERFTCGPDDSDAFWLNGDEGTNLLVDEFNTDRYGYIIDARVGGRTFVRDEEDFAERTFIEVA